MSKKAWLTPDTPPPEDERGRCFSVPDDLQLVGAVTGALLPLTDENNWEAFGSMTPAEAADIMSTAFEAFVSGDCAAECPPFVQPDNELPFFRRNAAGRFEQLLSDGSWGEPVGDYAIPTPAAREEETEEEQTCNAAANAAAVLATLYEAMTDFYATEVDPYLNQIEWAFQVSVVIGAAFGNISAAWVSLVEFAWDVFCAALGEVFYSEWDAQWQERLTCILQSVMTIDENGVARFNLSEVNNELVGFLVPIVDDYFRLRWQVWYMIQFLGVEGLEAAAAQTAETGDCVSCSDWFYTFDFTTYGVQGWTPVRETANILAAPGVFNGSQWQNTIAIDTGGSQSHTIMLGREFEPTTLTGIKVTYSRTNGQFTFTTIANRFKTNVWDGGVTTGTDTTVRSDTSPGATGTGLTLENTGTWTDVNCVLIRLSASVRTGATPSPAGSIAITRISLSGTGTNPFGYSNATELV